MTPVYSWVRKNVPTVMTAMKYSALAGDALNCGCMPSDVMSMPAASTSVQPSVT